MSSRMKIVLLLLIVLLVNQSRAADCAAVWTENDDIAAVARSVPLTPNFSSRGDHREFTMMELRTVNGELFRPENLAEAVCALRRMLDARTIEFIAEGVQHFVERSTGNSSSEDEFVRLRQSIDESLNRFNRHYPDLVISLTSTIFFEMTWQFGIRTGVYTDYPNSPLQQYALSQRVYSPSAVKNWIWVSFLGDLGVIGFDSDSMLQYALSLDADLAPPNSLNVAACPEPLSYEWRTSTMAASTFADPDYLESVHWGVCTSLSTLWVYHHRYGWSQANQDDEEYICGSQGNPTYLVSFCDSRP